MAPGKRGYGGGFIEHYVWPVIYPAGLTPAIQLGLGSVVLVLNAAGLSSIDLAQETAAAIVTVKHRGLPRRNAVD